MNDSVNQSQCYKCLIRGWKFINASLSLTNGRLSSFVPRWHSLTVDNLVAWVYIISQIILEFWFVLTYDLLEDKRIDDMINILWFLYDIKQEDSMLPCVCSVIDHRRHQNVVRTSVTHSPTDSWATFLFLTHFDVICDLFLNRRMATWNIAYTLFKTRRH